MNNRILLLVLILTISYTARTQEIEVMTLGTFHFAFPNLDVKKISKGDQIDVLDEKYQIEIIEIIDRLRQFRPTRIAIEESPEKQGKIDSIYAQYLAGNYELQRNESEQIGFRLAKSLNHAKLYCVNDWGRLPEEIQKVVYGEESPEQKAFMEYFYKNPDSSLIFDEDFNYRDTGILNNLRYRNTEAFLRKDLGNYLISVFKYETDDNPFFGVDFTSGWWYNRNLRIFRNIQRIPVNKDDRILVIFGSGHMNVLNQFFEASPEFKRIPVSDYLEY